MSVNSRKKNRVRPDISKKKRRTIGGLKVFSNIGHYFQSQKRKEGGGRLTRRRLAKRRGGANIANVFVPATNAQCS